ncbi:hypothetical protein ABB37_02919 [Leptomonas pyrrhocoris]|uniref:Uncharacterized protein n=1 Tax=Leptomonas pyrrhocoris TaxID=157538 RepID=A0A0M9G6F9_LEPPY|nr:hypothetical protein ABB37_02919 [Leptomonas pyrrhocoris]KPA83239.1 hypothetical protein ABB37_02919 [Leptomonas pyrrhocoris]|eukprot:XP_015661678.1 hypothetical protein ABB37_02919 [Leptomonas pyrrhocoris]
MSNFGYGDALPTRRPHSAQLHTGRVMADGSYGAIPKANRLPFYTFDPATLMDQSIETQLQRLYKGPEFDASPAHRFQNNLSRTYSVHPAYTTRSAARSPHPPSHGGVRPFYAYGRLPRNGRAKLRRPNSSSLPSPSSAQRTPSASSAAFRGVLSRQKGWRSRHRREDEAVEDGLESMQNLVGLDGYFVERPHFSYQPLSSSNVVAGITTAMLERNRGGASNGLPRSRAHAVTSAFSRSPIGALPLAQERQTAFTAADVVGLNSHHRPALASPTAHAVLQGRSSASHPPANTAELAPPPATTGRDKDDGSWDNGARPSTAPSSITALTSLRSSTSDCSNEGEEDVFFDEDPLSARPTQGETAFSANSPKMRETAQPAPVTHFPTATTTTAQGAQRSHGTLPKMQDKKPLPMSSRDVASTALTAARASPLGAAARDVGEGRTIRKTEERSPLAPSHTTPTITVELDTLAQYPRRRSVDALLKHLLQLRLQHQRTSRATGKCPSPAVTSSSNSTRDARARRGGSRHVPTQRPPASGSRKPASSQRFPRQSPRKDVRDSFYFEKEANDRFNDSNASADDGDDVYVHFYRRHRRCECCEVPVPRAVRLPQPPAPPPRSGTTVEEGRPRRGRRWPAAASMSASSPNPLPCKEASPCPVLPNAPPSSESSARPASSRYPCRAEAEQYEEEDDVDVREDQQSPPLSASIERQLLRLIARQDENRSADRARHTMQVLRTVLEGLQHAAEWSEVGLASTEGDRNNINMNISRSRGKTSHTEEEEETSKGVEPENAAADDALHKELLRLLWNNGHSPPTMHAYSKESASLDPLQWLHGGTMLPRPTPYATSERLYPYNIPHPPRPDASMETMPGTAGAPQETADHQELPTDEEGKRPAAHAAQFPTHSEESTSAEEPKVGAARTVAFGEAPGAPPPSAPPRPMEDKSVQTRLPSTQRISVGEAVEKRSSVAQTVAPVLAAPTNSFHPAEVEQKEEPRVFTLPPEIPAKEGEVEEITVLAPTAAATEVKRRQHQPTTDPDVQAALHTSLQEMQLQLLMDMESALRVQLARDETNARREIALDQLRHAEAVERWSICTAESKEHSPLLWDGRYGRDRLLMMELALNEWSRALEEEYDARTQMMAEATTEAAALKQRSETAARERELVNELLYEEARLRHSIDFTEALVRTELQPSICDYEERYAREEIGCVEAVAWLAMQRNLLMSAPQTMLKSPSSMGGTMHDLSGSAKLAAASSDVATPASQSHLQQNAASVYETEVSLTVAAEHEQRREGKKVPAAGNSTHAGFSKSRAPPFLSPALLVRSESEGNEGSTATPLSSADGQRSADASEKDKAAAGSHLHSSQSAVTAAAAVPDSLSNASTMFDALVFGFGVGHPVREASLEIVEAPAAPTTNVAVAEDLREMKVLSSPFATPQPPHPEAPREPNEDAMEEITTREASMSDGSNAARRVALETGFEAATEVLEARGVTNKPTDTSSPKCLTDDASATLHAEALAPTEELQGSTEAASAPETTAEQGAPNAAKPLTAGGRSPVVSPLKHLAVLPSSAAVEDPTTEVHQHSNVVAAATAPQAAGLLSDASTDSKSDSSHASSSNGRRRRQRGATRHRAAVADAIEIEEAGETRGLDEAGRDNVDTEALERTPTTIFSPDAGSATNHQKIVIPPLWRETAESSGAPQTLTFHSGLNSSDMNSEDEKGDLRARREGDGEDKKSSPSNSSDSDSKDESHSAKARSDVEKGEGGDDDDDDDDDDDEAQEDSDTARSGDDDNNAAFTADGLARVGKVAFSVSNTEVEKDKKDGGVASTSGLPAENMNRESSTDNRIFLSPLSTRSDVNTPHVGSQDDYSYCSTPAGAKRSLEENAKAAVAVEHDGPNRNAFRKDRVQMPTVLAPSQQTFGQVPHGGYHQHNNDHEDASMPSLSESSLSSPHLRDQDEAEEGEHDEEQAQEDEDEDEEAEEAEAGVDGRSGGNNNEVASTSAIPEAAWNSGSIEINDCRRKSSCTGKDELTLMHERIVAMKKVGPELAPEANKGDNSMKVGHGFTTSGDRPQMSFDSQLLGSRSRRTSRELSGSCLVEEKYANSPLTSTALVPGQSPGTRCKNPRGRHYPLVDHPGSEHSPNDPAHEEYNSGAVSHNSPSGSPSSISVAMSKTQESHYGSLDSDALTPVTRCKRAQCWEENGTSAVFQNPDAVPRPPTPEFVRNVLAALARNARQARDALNDEQDTDAEELAGVHKPLPHVLESDRAAAAEATPSTEKRKKNSSPMQDEGVLTTFGLRLEADIRDAFAQRRGASYVMADDGGDLSQPMATMPVKSQEGSSSKGDRDDGSVVQKGNLVPVATDAKATVSPSSTTAARNRPPFPWEIVGASCGPRVGETNELIPLTVAVADEWDGRAQNRSTQHRVRAPSPHPKALRRHQDDNSEESASVSADDELSPHLSPSMNDTRLMIAALDSSLPSGELATAQLQNGIQLHLVDSLSDNSSMNVVSHKSGV